MPRRQSSQHCPSTEQAKESDRQASSIRLCLKAAPQLAVSCNSAGNHNTVGTQSLGCGKSLLQEISHNRILKRRNQVQRLSIAKFSNPARPRSDAQIRRQRSPTSLDTRSHTVSLDITQNSRFDPAERKIKVRPFTPRMRLFVCDSHREQHVY